MRVEVDYSDDGVYREPWKASRVVIPRSSVIVGFAPAKGVCVSRAGRRRAEHTWDKDSRCVFCSETEGK